MNMKRRHTNQTSITTWDTNRVQHFLVSSGNSAVVIFIFAVCFLNGTQLMKMFSSVAACLPLCWQQRWPTWQCFNNHWLNNNHWQDEWYLTVGRAWAGIQPNNDYKSKVVFLFVFLSLWLVIIVSSALLMFGAAWHFYGDGRTVAVSMVTVWRKLWETTGRTRCMSMCVNGWVSGALDKSDI